MRSLEIYCKDIVLDKERSIRSCTIESKDGKRITSSKILKYELPHSIVLPNDSDAEAYIIATILLAMAENRTLKVHGSVSRTLLSNLTEFSDAWNCWLPNVYHKIDFEATTIDDSIDNKNNGAIAAFSGGLDSTFTVWQHTQKLAGYRSLNIKAGVMVHGFDIFNDNEYKSAFNQAQDTLNDVNISLYLIRTNYRSIIELNWLHTFGIALASCLNNFKKLCSKGIIAGSWSYNYNYYPHGTNPITDSLLSSSSIKILHDGGQFTRNQKVMGISLWKAGVNNLRVCFSGKEKDINCGKCEKCIRTKLHFEANGFGIPESLPNLKNGKAIRKLILRRRIDDILFIQTLALAKNNNIRIVYKWSYYYMILKSRIIRGILKPKIVRSIGRKLYNIFKMRK